MLAPSGDQYVIRAGGYTATITQAGATLRSLTYEDSLTYDDGTRTRSLVAGFADDAVASAGQGQLLMPWPNRIRDGRYSFGGASYQLGLTEPGRHNASHGLARWAAWSPTRVAEDSITLGYRLMAQSGYPWTLDLTATYSVGAEGLTVTQSATNRAASPAPYASGAHPYLTVGSAPLDEWTLELPVATRLLSDPERKLPAGREAAAGTTYDHREARPIGDTAWDHGFTDLIRDDKGAATVRVSGPEGAVELWVDDKHPWLMVYTGDDNADPRTALAVEPMTAPPDAFNSGEDLISLAPGDTFGAGWGIRAV